MKRILVVLTFLFVTSYLIYARDKNFKYYGIHHYTNTKFTNCVLICGTCHYQSWWSGGSNFRCIVKDNGWKYYKCKTCGTVYKICRHMHWCLCTSHIERLKY